MTLMDRRATLFGVTVAATLGIVSACAPRQARSQTASARPYLYDCEGCEGIAERDSAAMPARVRIAPDGEPGERMLLSGRAIALDGEPVEGVVVYAHHTDNEGLYRGGGPETEWSRRHGRLRAWARTGADGTYTFDTIKPAPYPSRTMPAHVHLFIQEPGRRPYYIDDVVFDGEFGIDAAYRSAREDRGGSGIIRLSRDAGGVWIARRDIRLERHPV